MKKIFSLNISLFFLVISGKQMYLYIVFVVMQHRPLLRLALSEYQAFWLLLLSWKIHQLQMESNQVGASGV